MYTLSDNERALNSASEGYLFFHTCKRDERQTRVEGPYFIYPKLNTKLACKKCYFYCMIIGLCPRVNMLVLFV